MLLAFLVAWFAWQGWARLEPVRDGAPGWSADGSRIVYYSERGGQADLFVMDADGSDRQPLVESPADEGGPALSPDGRYLAYDTNVDGNFEIYVRDLSTNTDRRITRHAGRDVAPAWHPDGDRLAFMSDREAPEFHVYEVGLDGSGLRRLTEEPSNWFPQYSPDGTRLAFHKGRDVHVMTLADGTVRRLTTEPLDGMHPSWSPDGTELVFMTSRNNRMELFRVNASGGEPERVVSMQTGGAIDPRWSPDGRQVVFVHVSETSPLEAQSDQASRVLYSVEIDTGQLRRLSR